MEITNRSLWIALTVFVAVIHISNANHCSPDNPTVEQISGAEGEFSIPADSMNIVSSTYLPGRLCQWEIITPENTIAHLSFRSLHLEDDIWGVCLYDHVTVMDPLTEVVSVFCGQPTDMPQVVASGNKLIMSFLSDSSVVKPGFTAYFWSTPITTTTGTTTTTTTETTTAATTTETTESTATTSNPTETTSLILSTLISPTTTSNVPTEIIRCSEGQSSIRLTSGSGRIGTALGGYSNGQKCTWIIIAPVGQRVLLEFEAFDVEYDTTCRYDSLTIFDADGSNNRMTTLCGSSKPLSVQSSGRFLTVVFTSDSSIVYEGFTASYSSIPSDEKRCTGLTELTETSGTFGSSEKSMYINNANCKWKITAPNEETIVLNFEYIDIESHSKCSYDSVTVYDGPDGSAPILEKKCGVIYNFSVTSTGNTLFVSFSSDSSIVFRGFKATYTTSNTPIITPALCGLQNGHSKIVGGVDAEAHSWPWQVSLQYLNGFHYCGGTLISENFVVTAAHCVNSKSAGSFKVVVGAHDRSAMGSARGQPIGVAEVIVHESYNVGGTLVNDIALLRLNSNVAFNSAIYPICLPASDVTLPASGVITGWGTLASGESSTPSILQEATVPIVSNIQCAIRDYGTYLIKPTMLCAGSEHGAANPVDTCQGDSGGPLVADTEGNGVYSLIGITSWGSGCATHYGVYTRVSMFLNWIESKRNISGDQS